ncbi:hypothetical protein [Zavarzinella formosa]|uniref:hypothetical protein n=1 Tax=Zavarzinella formosa TaxID=360055 RepID=UPI0002EC1A18|nr:hypothetical protein [Zavarzinella formosa]
MKPHHILTGFKGSQDGHGDGQEFVAGTTAHLSNDLARIAVGEGWAKPLATGGVVTQPERLPLVGETPSETVIPDDAPPAEDRETKVVEPEETKPAKKFEKKGKK